MKSNIYRTYETIRIKKNKAHKIAMKVHKHITMDMYKDEFLIFNDRYIKALIKYLGKQFIKYLTKDGQHEKLLT